NHVPIMRAAGLMVERYRWQADGGVLDADAVLADLAAARAGDIVLLHACCHNPTGYDITPAQWDQVVAAVKAKGLVP
ncbi:aminotransferase class I/II-fold pyridoxal phosphate-dependent enzyme, partial [Mycolicibacterium smegmatis]